MVCECSTTPGAKCEVSSRLACVTSLPRLPPSSFLPLAFADPCPSSSLSPYTVRRYLPLQQDRSLSHRLRLVLLVRLLVYQRQRELVLSSDSLLLLVPSLLTG